MSNHDLTKESIFHLDGSSAATSRKLHIRRLNDILHLSLERGDLTRARRAWAILARCKEFDWKTEWRTSLLLAPESNTSSAQSQQSGGRSVELLKKLMRFYPDEQESILQELTLHLASLGKFREALDELDLYLPSFPYQDNPVLHSYAGLMTLKLASSIPQDDDAQTEENRDNLLREAQKRLATTLSIDPDNTVAKYFTQEVTDQLAAQDTTKSELEDETLSDGEMEVDFNDPLSRGKRLRRTTTEK